MTLPAGANLDAVQAVADKALPDLPFRTVTLPSGPALQGTLTAGQIRDRQDYAIEQNLVNSAQPRQCSWASPSPSCSARAWTASMCSCRACRTPPRSRTSSARWRPWSSAWTPPTGDAYDVAQHGNAPVGTKLYYDTQGTAGAAQARDHRHRR